MVPGMEMSYRTGRVVFAFLLASLGAGCAHVDKHPQPAANPQRQMLNEGYSMLYHDADNLDLSELMLYVKSESDAMKSVVTAISEAGGDVKKELQRIAKEYPAVR